MKHFIIILLYSICFVLTAHSKDKNPSETIKRVTYVEVKNDKLVQTDSVILQINERMGDHDAEIFIPYTKGDKVTINDAWIEDMSGNIIRRLKNKDITDRSAISDISLYEDDFVKSFELKHNTYPYRIVYSYKVVYSKYIHISNLRYRTNQGTIKEGKLVAKIPLDRAVRYKQRNIDSFCIDTLANEAFYIWEYSYEHNDPQTNTSLNTYKAPYINLLPLHFRYGEEGSFENWKTFGNWVYRLNRNKNDLTLSEKQKIDNMLKGVESDVDKARILYHYLQDYTRYINVKIDIGGFQSFPASYVCINKYGDCKALTNYMQSMLSYAGIKSYYTLISAGDQVIEIDPDFPSQDFNHVILTVPFGKDTTYLECTSKNTAFGYVGTFIQGRKALLVDQDNSRLIGIPPLKPSDVLCTRHFNVNLNTSDVKLTATERGSNYESSSYTLAEIDKNTVDKYIRNTILFGSYDLLDFKFTKLHRDSTNIRLDANLKMHNLYKEYGNNISLSNFRIYIPPYEAVENRTADVQLDYPEYYMDTIIYEIGNKKIRKIPADFEKMPPYGIYSYKYELLADNKFAIYKSIIINSGIYSLSNYEEFYNFIQLIKGIENKNIYIEIE